MLLADYVRIFCIKYFFYCSTAILKHSPFQKVISKEGAKHVIKCNFLFKKVTIFIAENLHNEDFHDNDKMR